MFFHARNKDDLAEIRKEQNTGDGPIKILVKAGVLGDSFLGDLVSVSSRFHYHGVRLSTSSLQNPIDLGCNVDLHFIVHEPGPKI